MEKIRLLIVDETAKAREIIRYALENSFSKIEIDEACSNTEAREKLESRYYDLILCDWESRSISGNELLKWMREHPELKKTSFIMVTASNDRASLVDALQTGATSYLIKPFSVVGLVHRVISVVSRLDRRVSERFVSDSPVSLAFQDRRLDGALIDISMSGLLGTFKREGIFPQILERVVMSLSPEGSAEIAEIHGVVVRIQSAETDAASQYINIAVKFMHISSENKKALLRFFDMLKLKL